jgi:hypothetical protein
VILKPAQFTQQERQTWSYYNHFFLFSQEQCQHRRNQQDRLKIKTHSTDKHQSYYYFKELTIAGDLVPFKTKRVKKKEVREPLLEKLKVFGSRGDPRRKQANQIYQYWKKNYFETGKYDKLLQKYHIQSSIILGRIPAIPLNHTVE